MFSFDRSHKRTKTSAPQLPEWGHWLNGSLRNGIIDQMGHWLNGVSGWMSHWWMVSMIKSDIGWMGSLAEWGYSAEWDHWSNGALAEWGQWWMVHYAFRCFTPFAFNLFFFCKRTACAKLKAGMTTPIFYPQHWFVPSHEATVTNRMTHSCYEQKLSS